MGKKVIIKEVGQPIRELELEDGYLEDCVAPLMANAGDVKYIPLNRMQTMLLVVNGMSGFELPDNFLYVENGGVQKDGLIPTVKTAHGTAFFVRVTWEDEHYRKKAKLESITYDDFIYARNFMTEVYQRDLRDNPYPTAFN